MLSLQTNQDAHFSILQLEDGDIFIDIGAHQGSVAVKASKLAKDIKFILIEPDKAHYGKLYNNVKNLDFILITTAAGDITTTGKISPGGSLLENQPLAPQGPGSKPANIDTLDNILRRNNVLSPNFVKIDTEGYAPHVLRGFTPTPGTKFHIEYHWNLGNILYEMSNKNIEPLKIEVWNEFKGSTGAIHGITG